MKFTWREGARPPTLVRDGKEVTISAEAVAKELRKLDVPSPENLLHASKASDHVLHSELWREGDQVWAQRGRMERCREIIRGIHEITTIGGKTITNRTVEFVRVKGEGIWAHMDAILADPDLEKAYLAEIEKLQQQALAKIQRYRALKSGEDGV
jgi:hypothetical protein